MKLFEKLNQLNELVMFKHTIFSIPFIFIAMVVSANGWFGWNLFFMALLASVLARNFAMSLNRYVDRDIDKLNPRTQNRPSVDGRMSERFVLVFVVGNAVGFVAVAYFINTLALILSIPILAVIGGYSFFKRFSNSAHFVLGLSLSLAPIAGVVAIENGINAWVILLSIGVMYWVAGFDLLYSLQDMEFDKELGLFSIPSTLGDKATLFISELLHINTIIFWLFFAYFAHLGELTYLGIAVSAWMLYYEHKLVRNNLEKIDKAFFTINGYVGIVMLLFVVLDVMYG